jgi:hypothetical protein
MGRFVASFTIETAAPLSHVDGDVMYDSVSVSNIRQPLTLANPLRAVASEGMHMRFY